MKFSLTLIAAAVLLGSTSADTTYYFNTELAADPIAVPTSEGSQSTGSGEVTVKSDGSVVMDIRWEVRGDDGPIDDDNALIGIHIHSGDADTNGPIVFGFCGQDPLPSFGGTCQQGWPATSAQIATQYAGKICDLAPPAPCYHDGKSTAEEAAQALINGEDMYVNIHTTKSFAATKDALGLIRGQLIPKKQHSFTSIERKTEKEEHENDKNDMSTIATSTQRASNVRRTYRKRTVDLNLAHAPEEVVVGDGTNGQVGPFEEALGQFHTGNVFPIVAGQS
ncbi:hypothetical protein THAOC_25547, partial [Thalassiosira oceanica]